MKKVFVLFTLIISMNAFAQKADILEKLKDYDFSEEILTENLKDADAQYSFDFKTTTINSNETKVEEGVFDPKRPIGERWVLKTVNGGSPTKKDLKSFDKAHNTKQEDVNGELDENEWRLEDDNADYVVISFKYDKNTLPKKYAFLGDCKGMAYLSKNTKKIEKVEFVNVGDLKIKIFNVTNLDMVVYYNDDVNLIHKEELLMDVKMLGEIVEIKEINEYSNYKKV